MPPRPLPHLEHLLRKALRLLHYFAWAHAALGARVLAGTHEVTEYTNKGAEILASPTLLIAAASALVAGAAVYWLGPRPRSPRGWGWKPDSEHGFSLSEEQFRAFMDQSPVVAWVKDENFRFRYVNAAFEKLFDRPADSIIGKEDHDIYPHESAEETRRNDIRLQKDGALPDTIENVPGADGVMHNWLVHKFVIRNRLRKDWLGGTAVDITARAKAEQEARLSTFGLEHSGTAFHLLDPSGRILRVNQTNCDMLGYARHELLELSFSDVCPNLSHKIWDLHWKDLKSQRNMRFESEFVHKFGRRIPIGLNISYVEFEGSEYSFVFAYDLTDIKATANALTRSKNHLRSIVESNPECLKTLARDCTLVDMNPAGLALVEADRLDDVRGRDVSLLVHEEDREAFINLNREAFDGKSGRLEFRLLGLKGARRWMETNVTPLRDENGEIISALSVTRDITQRRKDEALLSSLVRDTANATGEDYLRGLVRGLARATGTDYVLIGELNRNTDSHSGAYDRKISTLCIWAKGQFADNFEYHLEGTPCANVMDTGICIYESSVAELFPEDQLLVDMGVQSYIGVSLVSRDGDPMGILVMLDSGVIEASEKTKAIFQLFAERASLELENSRSQRAQNSPA